MPPLIASIRPPDGVRSVRANRKGHNLTVYSAKPTFSGAGHRRATILKSHEAGSYTKNANYSGLVKSTSNSPTNSPKSAALGSRSLTNAVKSRLEPGQMSDSSKSPTRRSPSASRSEPAPFQPTEPIPGRAAPGESIEVVAEAPKMTEPVVSVRRSRSQTAVRAKMDANATLLDPDRDTRRSFGGKSGRDSVFARHMKRLGTAPANVEPRAKEKEGEGKWSPGSTADTADTGEKDRPSGPNKPILHHPVDRPRRIPKTMETTFRGPDGDERICPPDWSKLVECHGRTLHKDEYLETFAHQMEQTEHPYQERDYSPPRNQIAEDRLEYDSNLAKHVHHVEPIAVRVDPALTNRMKTAPDLYSYGRQLEDTSSSPQKKKISHDADQFTRGQLDDTSSSPQKKKISHDADQFTRGRQLEETSSSRLQKRLPQEPDQNNRGQIEDIPMSPLQSTKLQSCLKKKTNFEQHQNNNGRFEAEKNNLLQSSMRIRPKSTADLHDSGRVADDGQYSDAGSGGSGGSGNVRTQSAADLNVTGSRPGTPTQTKRRSRDLPVSNTAFTDRSLRMREGTHARNGVLSHGPGINDDKCHPQGKCNGNNRPGENRAAGQVSHGVQDHRFPHCIQAHKKAVDGSSSVPVPHTARAPVTERYGRQAACEPDIINSGEFSVDKHIAAQEDFGKEMGRKARNAFANQEYATAAGNAPIKDEQMPTNRGCIGQGPADDAREHITPCLTESPLPLAPISASARAPERERLRADGCFKDGFTDFVHKQQVYKNPRSHRFAWKHELRSKSVPPDRDVTRNPVTFDRVLPKEDVCGVRDREDPGIQAGNPARRPTVVVPGRSYGQTSPRHNPGTDSIQMWKAVTYEGFHSAPNERNHRLAQDNHFSNLCKHTETHKKNQVNEMAAIRDKSIYVTSPRLTECMQWG